MAMVNHQGQWLVICGVQDICFQRYHMFSHKCYILVFNVLLESGPQNTETCASTINISINLTAKGPNFLILFHQ